MPTGPPSRSLSGSQELMNQSQRKESLSEEADQDIKCCAQCKTTKSPLWRSGPAGPKSLCNACGIRYRKKRDFGVDVGVSKDSGNGKENSTSTIPTKNSSGNNNNSNNKKLSGRDNGKDAKLRVRLMALGKEVVMLQRQRSPMRRHSSSKKMGEEEQAAVLLMALSHGSLSAWKRW